MRKANKILFCQAYIYYKIKSKARGTIISVSDLKEILCRNILCGNSNGGDRRGIPHHFLWNVVKDLELSGLLERLDHTKYRILQSRCDEQFKKEFPW